MKLNVFIFQNVILNCFTTPTFDDHDPEVAAIQLKRSLIVEKDITKVDPYKNLRMYHLGTFDDDTGKLDVFPEPVLLLDCTEVVKGRGDYVESKPIERKA